METNLILYRLIGEKLPFDLNTTSRSYETAQSTSIEWDNSSGNFGMPTWSEHIGQDIQDYPLWSVNDINGIAHVVYQGSWTWNSETEMHEPGVLNWAFVVKDEWTSKLQGDASFAYTLVELSAADENGDRTETPVSSGAIENGDVFLTAEYDSIPMYRLNIDVTVTTTVDTTEKELVSFKGTFDKDKLNTSLDSAFIDYNSVKNIVSSFYGASVGDRQHSRQEFLSKDADSLVSSSFGVEAVEEGFVIALPFDFTVGEMSVKASTGWAGTVVVDSFNQEDGYSYVHLPVAILGSKYESQVGVADVKSIDDVATESIEVNKEITTEHLSGITIVFESSAIYGYPDSFSSYQDFMNKLELTLETAKKALTSVNGSKSLSRKGTNLQGTATKRGGALKSKETSVEAALTKLIGDRQKYHDTVLDSLNGIAEASRERFIDMLNQYNEYYNGIVAIANSSNGYDYTKAQSRFDSLVTKYAYWFEDVESNLSTVMDNKDFRDTYVNIMRSGTRNFGDYYYPFELDDTNELRASAQIREHIGIAKNPALQIPSFDISKFNNLISVNFEGDLSGNELWAEGGSFVVKDSEGVVKFEGGAKGSFNTLSKTYDEANDITTVVFMCAKPLHADYTLSTETMTITPVFYTDSEEGSVIVSSAETVEIDVTRMSQLDHYLIKGALEAINKAHV